MRLTCFASASLLAFFTAGLQLSADTINYTGAVQTFIVPTTGTYTIVAYGASGGDRPVFGVGGSRGLGAEIGGDFALTMGEILNVYVGGAGGNALDGGGGGGTFVTDSGGFALVVAGGGGGAGFEGNGGDGQTSSVNSSGGAASPDGEGGGGGGFTSAGGSASFGGGGGGGAYPTLTGGHPNTIGATGGSGGFGGGGGAGAVSGGGGGGYSGGAGGSDESGGGGGGSFDAGTNQILIAGANSGNGFVTINPLAPTVPEPTSLALLGAGILGLGVIRKRRNTNGQPSR